jgi:hypothetical protein
MRAHEGPRCVSGLNPWPSRAPRHLRLRERPLRRRAQGAPQRRGANSRVPRAELAARSSTTLEEVRVPAARPTQCVSASTSLPRAGPRPRQPWARDQPYGVLSLRSTPAFEHAFDRSHIVRSACSVRVWMGAVEKSSASPTGASRVTLRRPSQGPVVPRRTPGGCPGPSSPFVLHDARRGAWPHPQDVAAARPHRCLSPSTKPP